jgi:hypothetical protein
MSHERRTRPHASLHEAIEHLKESVTELRGVPGGLEGRLLDLDKATQDAYLRLRDTLNGFGAAAALLSSVGSVILSSDSFEEVGAGSVGDLPVALLRDVVRGRVESASRAGGEDEPFVAPVRLDTPAGGRPFLAQVIDVGDGEGTLLLILHSEPGPDSGESPA